MIKQFILVGVVVLSGCATRTPTVMPETRPTLPYYTMDNFKADCLYGETQRKFLEDRIEEYQLYHRDRAVTEQDRLYYNKLKNSLWGLRSACGSNR